MRSPKRDLTFRFLAFVLLMLAHASTVVGNVVITEIHYEPEDITEPSEFIEIYNSGGEAVDLGGWSFADGILYDFPDATMLPAAGYLVLASEPTVVAEKYGISVLGSYDGKLSNQGEEIVLVNAAREEVDRVDYRIGFPWPIAAAGGGSSMGLIHPLLDNDLGGSWRSETPTPGAQNSVFAANAPPQIRQVRHAPQQPRADEEITITAKVTDPDGVAAVSVLYQIVSPGDYIPALLPHSRAIHFRDPSTPQEPNPDFEDPANWTRLSMTDDGSGGDEVASDDVFTAKLPAQPNRTLVRYRIESGDRAEAGGAVVLVPYADDPSLNFALFVYDGVPGYTPTARTVHPAGLGHTYSAELMNSLPVYTLITRATDLERCVAYDGTFQIDRSNKAARSYFNWEGAFVYDGVVYDHVRYRLRGHNKRYQLRMKRSMRFRFNKGHFFQARDQRGEEYPTEWRTLLTGKMFGPRDVGGFGVTETMNNFLWDLLGVPAPFVHTFHFRVIDGAEEAPTGESGQYTGDFWGMFLAIEDYDVRFLRARDLPRGNLYKLKDRELDGGEQQRYQAADAVAAAEDYDTIVAELHPTQDVDWLERHVDWEQFFHYHTVVQAIRHYDHGVFPTRENSFPPVDTPALKNAAWYFAPSDDNPLGKLWILPFDTDQSWGPNGSHQGWDMPSYAMIAPRNDTDYEGDAERQKSELYVRYRNVLREFRDLVWNEETLNPMIDRYAAVAAEFSPADRDRWKDHPLTGGELSDFGALEDRVADMKVYAFEGGSHWPVLGRETSPVAPGGRAIELDARANVREDETSIPGTPTVTYVGDAEFSIRGLTFETTPFDDPQGAQTFAALKWRVGEVTDVSAPAYDPAALPIYEWTEVWTSGELTDFAAQVTVPPGAVQVGRSYRLRARMKDDSGRWGHWSAPVSFVPTLEETETPGDVIISEFFADAQGSDDGKEWIELFNTTDAAIDLTGWVLRDNGEDAHSVGGDGPVIIGPKGYLVLGESLDAEVNGGIAIDYAFGDDITLGNSADEIILMQGQSVIHSLGYGEFSSAPMAIVTDVGAEPERGAALGMGMDYCAGPVGVWENQTSSSSSSTSPGTVPATGTPGADNDGVAVCVTGGTVFMRGDVNSDLIVNLSDAVAIVEFLFRSGAEPTCMKTADADDDGKLDAADVMRVLGYLFISDGPLPEPAECSLDPTADDLSCREYPICEG